MNTPRTDAFEKQRIVEATTNDIATEAWADFARQLERELNEAKKETPTADAVIWREAYNDSQRELDSFRRQNEKLREALRYIARCPMGSHLKLEDAPELARKALADQPEEKTK